jgi:hypothetical protein
MCGTSVDSPAARCSSCGEPFLIPEHSPQPLTTSQAFAIASSIAAVVLLILAVGIFLVCAGLAVWLIMNYPALSIPRELRF